jgi:hypothetical protein
MAVKYSPDKRYVVTGAYVTVKTATTDGVKFVGLYSGSPWPQDATQEAGQHHLSSGLIAEVGKPAEVETPDFVRPTTPVDPETVTLPAGETAEEEAEGRRRQAQGAEDTRAAASALQGSAPEPQPQPRRTGSRGKG